MGSTLSRDIPSIPGTDLLSYIKKETPQAIYLRPATEQEVQNSIHTLKKTSGGADNIASKLVKKTSYPEYLAPHSQLIAVTGELSQMSSKSLKSYQFTKMKTAH